MSTKTLDNHSAKSQTATGRRSWLQNTKRAHRNPATRPGTSVEASHNDELTMQSQTRPADKLPDPWLFDSEALIRELDRCRETVLQIPITHPNATHFGIQLAVNAIYKSHRESSLPSAPAPRTTTQHPTPTARDPGTRTLCHTKSTKGHRAHALPPASQFQPGRLKRGHKSRHVRWRSFSAR